MSERFLVRSRLLSLQPAVPSVLIARARTHTQHRPPRPLGDEKSPATGFHEPATAGHKTWPTLKRIASSSISLAYLALAPSIYFLPSPGRSTTVRVVLRFCASSNCDLEPAPHRKQV
jgi:hypothetical protein